MSALCEMLTVLHLTFGVFCQGGDARMPALPLDEEKAWEVPKPKPEPPPLVPMMPPIIIKALEAPKPPEPKIRVEPPNPYRLALEAAFHSRGQGAGFSGAGLVENLLPPSAPSGLLGLSLQPAKAVPPVSQERYQSPGEISGLPVDNGRIFAADRYIPAVVETGVNSQLDSSEGGEMIVQTARDVFGYHGRNILIPKGSRMICDYEGPKKQGETRITFQCKRILFAGNRAEILQLKSPLGDQQGHGGVTGEVDNRFWEKYGTAFILAGLSASMRLSSAALTQGGNTSQNQSAIAQTTDRGSQELSQKLGEITASVLEQTVNLRPIVRISQGARVQIRPGQDWYIRRIGEETPPQP